MEPLPAGWVDSGLSLSVTNSGTAKILVTPGDIVGDTSVYALLNEWKLHGTGEDNFDPGCPVGNQVNAQRFVYIEGPHSLTPTLQEDLSAGCQPDGVLFAPESAEYAFFDTAGPYRLGVTYELIGASQNPNHAKDYQQ